MAAQHKKVTGHRPLIGTVHVDELDADQIMSMDRSSGHPGVRFTI